MHTIPLSVPHMSGLEEPLVRDAFASNWLSTTGPHVRKLEEEIGARVGAHAAALNSGTAAIHLALELLGVGPGDDVCCPTLTFIASANPITYLGARPVFLDSETTSWNLDPRVLADALAERARVGRLPKAVIAVHLLGQCADMDAITGVCREYGIPVLDEAAEALGATYKGRPAGSLGDAGVFSLNGNKIITSTGGGVLVSHNAGLVERARFLASQARDAGRGYAHSARGYNYALSNVLAAIARGQLQVLDERVEQRRAVQARYADAFADLPGIVAMPEAPWGRSTRWLSCFLISPAFGLTRDDLIDRLTAEAIESRPLWKPLHLQPLFASAPRYGGAIAEDLSARGICLPSSSSLSQADQERVVNAVRTACGHGASAVHAR